MIHSIEPDGSFEFVNRAWLEALGYSDEDLKGLHLKDILFPGYLKKHQDLISQVLKGKIETDVEVVLVVRSTPTLNDATMRESQFVGINEVATVIENGIHGPLPGTILRRCSKEVRELFDRADLIISKGGGNFDTLDEERKHLKNNFTFIFLSKCYPYYRYFDVPLLQPILANSFASGKPDYSIE